MTAPTTNTWRDHAAQLEPWQIDQLEISERAPWSHDPDAKAPTLLAIAREYALENAAEVGA